MPPEIVISRQFAAIGICLLDLYLLSLWFYATIRTGIGFLWLFVGTGVFATIVSFLSLALTFEGAEIQHSLGPLFLPFMVVFTVIQPLYLTIAAIAHTLLVIWLIRNRATSVQKPNQTMK
jgi:hypothetical protein